jgi:hypothetical protein
MDGGHAEKGRWRANLRGADAEERLRLSGDEVRQLF